MRNEVKWYHVVILLLIGCGAIFWRYYEPAIRLEEGEIGVEEGKRIMYGMFKGQEARSRLLERILEADDKRFIIVLMDYYAMGGENGYGAGRRVFAPKKLRHALADLSGQEFENKLDDWFQWYRTTDLVPPPGYSAWKGELLGRHNSKLRNYFTENMPTTIRLEEIVWGGVSERGLPPLDSPALVAPSEATYLNDEDAVVGIKIDGESRAYPLRIIDWHEMINDEINETPFTIAYCTLCYAAIAFDRSSSDGTTYSFDSSGCLYRSNKLMIDRGTLSMWNQMTGEPVTGPLVGKGIKLTKLPLVTTTWGAWKAQHPETKVLSVDTGYDRIYDPGWGYGQYFSTDGLKQYAKAMNTLLPAKEIVYGLTLDEHAKAWTIEHLVASEVLNDQIGDLPVVLIASSDEVVVKGLYLGKTSVEYSAGAEVRAYRSEGYTFKRDPAGGDLVDESGTVWTRSESALTDPEGNTLERYPGHLAYWFGWSDFHADTELVPEPKRSKIDKSTVTKNTPESTVKKTLTK